MIESAIILAASSTTLTVVQIVVGVVSIVTTIVSLKVKADSNRTLKSKKEEDE